MGIRRMGILLRIFSLCLSRIGFSSPIVLPASSPRISKEGLLVIVSSSEKTSTVPELLRKAHA